MPAHCLLLCSGAADVREAAIAVGLKPKQMTKQERQQFSGRTRIYLQARCVSTNRQLRTLYSSCLLACTACPVALMRLG